MSGEGSFRYSGRWHTKGSRVVYTSGSVALAVLETLVHLEPALAPQYLLLRISVPQGLAICRVEPSSLAEDWAQRESLSESQQVGQQWLAQGEAALLQVPSVVVPPESNFVLNVSHPDFSQLAVESKEPYFLDNRLL